MGGSPVTTTSSPTTETSSGKVPGNEGAAPGRAGAVMRIGFRLGTGSSTANVIVDGAAAAGKRSRATAA